jgi:hypothetical protein
MAKRHGPGYWGKHLEAFYQGELTQREYCAKHGLHERTFYRWHMRHKQGLAAQAPLTLVPAQVGVAANHGVLRLSSPGGWTVEVPHANAAWLAGLLRELP